MSIAANPYETDSLLSEYLMLHFGSAQDVFGSLPGPREAVGFPQRCVTELMVPPTPGATAFDVGCAVGGSAFEMAKSCESVLGVDYSRGFVAAARHLAADGRLSTSVLVEAGRTTPFEAIVDPAVDRSRVSFEVADATALPETIGPFDVVLAANLLCRLPAPMRFLERLPALVKPGGQLLLTTPFTWLEDYTPRELWLGRERSGLEDLKGILADAFTLEFQVDLPFLIREHSRKFQYGISLGMRWRREFPE